MTPRKATPKPAKPVSEPKPEPKTKAVKAKPMPKAAAPKAVEATPLPLETEPEAAPLKPAKAAKAPKSGKAGKAATVPASEAPADPLGPHARKVHEAIVQGKALEFIFADGDANPARTFEPRSLAFDALAQAWFVWGWDRRYNAERHHRLDLLAEVNDVDGVGRSAQGPYKEGTPANQIGGWLGGEPIPVKALLMKQWLFAVKQAPPPFPAFQMEDAEEGKALVTFTATDLRAIARWCMQFGDGIQVLEPQRLVDRIKQVGVAWGGKPAPAPAPQPKAAPLPPPPPPPRPHREQEERPKAAPKNSKIEVRIERL
jgi:predicted DNA-binding transcriptional regulator YafY